MGLRSAHQGHQIPVHPGGERKVLHYVAEGGSHIEKDGCGSQIVLRLTRLWRDHNCRRVVHEGINETPRELKNRGYRLGIISNLSGENEIPDWLRADGLDRYFDSVVPSSVCHIRKPDPRMYRMGCDELRLRAYPEITGVPIAPSNFAPDEGDLTRHTLCMVRKIDEVWHKICKQAVHG